jgi:hypothetical protein
MADIFDEIDEEMKQDRAKAVWLRYGKYLAAAAAAVVLGVGASQGFSAWKQSQAEAAANAYQQALSAEDAVSALQGELAGLSDGYGVLARFRIAAGKAEAGDAAGAEADYLALATDTSLSNLYREAATLLSAMNAPDTAKPSDLQDRLAPIAEGTSPWRPLALELSAAFDLKIGNRDAALAKLQSIIEMEETPAELRQRAAQLAEVLKS